MDSERTQTSGFKHFSYNANQLHVGERRTAVKPVDVILFDRVELSGDQPGCPANYDWLTASIARMSDDSVIRKMKKYRDSFLTVEDALTEKIIMEAL